MGKGAQAVEAAHPTDPVTRKLLLHWADPTREERVLFCQREVAETAIYLDDAIAALYADQPIIGEPVT